MFTFSWPTSGNRLCLLHNLWGFAENAARYGRRPHLLVAVDAEMPPETEHRFGEALLQVRQRYGLQGRLFSLAARAGLYDRLKDLCPLPVLQYALESSPDGPGWGVNVNASMLLTAGSYLLSTDDDIECRPAILHGERLTAQAVFSQTPAPAVFRFYRNRETLLRAVQPVEADLLGAYAALLGKTAGQTAPPEQIDAEVAPRVIRTVSPGIYGDTAMEHSRSLVAASGEARTLLHGQGYEQLRLTRELVRIPAAPSVTHSLMFLATQFAADNRPPLPPFMTYGRNIDGAFMHTLRILYPDTVAGHLGFGLYHNPPVQRMAVPADLSSPSRNLSDILTALVIDAYPPNEITSVEERFVSIGEHLQRIAELSNNRFVEYVYDCIYRKTVPACKRMQELLERYAGESSEAWISDMEALIERTEETLREPSAMYGTAGCGLSPGRARHHIGMYGRLLQVWPRLHARCAEGQYGRESFSGFA